LMVPGIPLSILTAVYTAYLFAQAKARDLWQNPLLPPHLLVQSITLGAIALAPFGSFPLVDSAYWRSHVPEFFLLLWIAAAGAVVHLLMVWGEVSLTHGSAHARLAIWEMTRGRYSGFFGVSIILSVGALATFAFGQTLQLGQMLLAYHIALLMLLIGLMLYEHAYVQAGQSVPLA